MKEFENIYQDESKCLDQEYVAKINLVANSISELTKKAGTMLPKEPEEIKHILTHGVSAVIWDGEKPVAFAAVAYEWPNNWKELGGLVVHPDYRKKGIGHKVTEMLIEEAKGAYPDANLFALCNKDSLKIMLDFGAEIITDTSILPKEIFGECLKCSNYQKAKSEGKICCDTPVLIK